MKRIIIFLCFSFFLMAQNGDGEQSEIKELLLNSNEVSTLVFNYGAINAPNRLGNVADFYWRGLGYMFEFGPVFGGEVVNADGDTLHIFSDTFIRPMQGDYSPIGEKWGFLPSAGYANPEQNEIANVNNPASWNPSWQEWPGEFGDGYIVGLNEAYYKMDDLTNAEFNYYPFESDTTKRGLGLETEVRSYQLDGRYKNSVLIKYKITNISDKPIYKTYLGFQGDPHIGGTSDYADDLINFVDAELLTSYPEYSMAENTILCYDADNIGIMGREPGVFGFKILESPDNLGLTSFHALPYTNALPNVPLNDELMWNLFSSGIDQANSFFTNPGDYVVSFGTGPFTFEPGETKELSLILFLADDMASAIADADLFARTHSRISAGNELGLSGGDENYSILIEPFSSGSINGTVDITWQYTGTDQNALVDIDYYSRAEGTFLPLASGIPVNSSYQWDTKLLPDGMNYALRVIAYNADNYKQFYYDVSDEKFTIDNPEVNAIPEIGFVDFEGGMKFESPINIEWEVEDADNSLLEVIIELGRAGEPYLQIYSETLSLGSYSFNWEPEDLANNPSCHLRLKVSDGENTVYTITNSFALNIYDGIYEPDNFDHIAGIGTPEIRVEVIDENAITGDEYEISFNTSEPDNVTFSVKNVTTDQMKVESFPVNTGATTAPFEGIALKIKDILTSLNTEKSGFTNSDLDTLFSVKKAGLGNPVSVRDDWYVIFNSPDTNAAGEYLSPGDTVLSTNGAPVICPFRTFSSVYDTTATYRIIETIPDLKNNGRYDFGETILIQPTGDQGFNSVYEITLFDKDVKPAQGDTLWIWSYKSVTDDDLFRFITNSEYIVGIDKDEPVVTFKLENNYPNPFNPSTTINFAIPSEGFTELKVFDILGREVDILLKENLKAGNYSVKFNAGRDFASGIYIYTLRSNNYLATKKMILLK